MCQMAYHDMVPLSGVSSYFFNFLILEPVFEVFRPKAYYFQDFFVYLLTQRPVLGEFCFDTYNMEIMEENKLIDGAEYISLEDAKRLKLPFFEGAAAGFPSPAIPLAGVISQRRHNKIIKFN